MNRIKSTNYHRVRAFFSLLKKIWSDSVKRKMFIFVYISHFNLFKELKVVHLLLLKKEWIEYNRKPAQDSCCITPFTFCLHRGKKSLDYLCGILRQKREEEKKNVNHIQISRNLNRIQILCSHHIFCGRLFTLLWWWFKQRYCLFINEHLLFKNRFILKKN